MICATSGKDVGAQRLTSKFFEYGAAIATASRRAACRDVQTFRILVTLAERPHPFPSRTRKLSSPAPKILRGQPFGKIGRRQDFDVSGGRDGPEADEPDGRLWG
jgi:hypothetical protein